MEKAELILCQSGEKRGAFFLGSNNVCKELVSPKAHSTSCVAFLAIACESNKAAVTHSLSVVELT